MAGWGSNDLGEAAYPRSDVGADGRPFDGGWEVPAVRRIG